ncbi:LONG CHAIN ACYL-COA SYNTHETASE 1 [Salix koriyanagi]|uniref:Long-chain-fatty-acid--CoA ligase n=1 Tax=Salix koriyanagi TaxID=2511006 RepID=A0A9Q0TFG0_9ROSI|nr:LONG CHAIN ACYL-COA SYNTHETASE 1 [Salix koriyanagi]KAJ6710632.1 LONG CHAIN ACYL-COA SYNTHETASE 1 [Salix koriyanagi]KAJ6710633.1 LONG CHAIN ACYL-COA SYNTHETASE 1 [Salix koriyanagi]
MALKEFSAQVEEGRGGKDGKPSVGPVYRNLLSKNEYPPLDRDVTTSWDLFSLSAKKYAGNKMLGWRRFVDGKVGPYVWKTYQEVYDEVLKISSALRASGAEAGCRVGIYGSNCPQWIVAMEACSARSLVCVPLYDTIGPRAVNYIIDHAEIDFVFVQDKKVKELLNPDCTSAQRLKAIVCFTSLTEEEKDRAAQMGIKSYSWEEYLCMGKENPLEIFPPQSFNICTIMYTSGTSGDPKGVVILHETVAAFVRGIDLFMEQFEDKMTPEDVYLSFLPLAHVLDRMIEEYFFRKGASVGYYHGDLNALRDDLMELKPTCLAGVPRVFEKIQEGIKKALQELSPLRRQIFDALYRYKLGWMNRGYKQKYASPLADLLAFRKVKARLGGRLRLVICGGASLSTEVEEFLRVTCCAFVIQGYGLTESCGPATMGFPDEMCMLGTVGAAAVYNELCLEEVPEMGYDPLGNPPCGEICLRGKTLFSGYYKNPELTRESMKDGWFHTGDIGEILPNGVIKIIDRKKNLIKLSQGEYIALEYLENVYNNTPIVEDIWIYGDTGKSTLVAVVVLHEENTKSWAYLNGHMGSFTELCSLHQLQKFVLSELKITAERNKLKGFEHIKGVILECCLFDIERDLVTATLKKKRNKLVSHYRLEIDELYQKLAEGRA